MNSPDNLRLALVQMTSSDVPLRNLELVQAAFSRAREQDADLCVFPENTIFFRIQAGSKILGLDAPMISELEKLVNSSGRSKGTALMLTTAVEDSPGKFRNSTWLFEPGTAGREVYAKIHLFDVDVVGAPSVRESEYFVNGEGPRMISFRGWNLGLSICYDVRFAELYLNYAQKADLILVPSAFLVPTGEAHWHALLRARAIEAQCYVAAPAQTGAHVAGGQTRRTYGHSLVVSPWGKVIADLDGGPDVVTVELVRDEIQKVRKQIPMARHRRLKQD